MSDVVTRSYGVPDKVDENGNYIKSYYYPPMHRNYTRSFVLWEGIKHRVEKLDIPCYKGVAIDFIDYQDFASWCNEQYGYCIKDGRGKFWQIDKDLLSGEGKSYSRDTCLFIPAKLNSIYSNKEKYRNGLPRGTSWVEARGKYRSYCQTLEGSQKHLGYFDKVADSHKAWQEYFVTMLKEMVRCDVNLSNHTKLVDLLNQTVNNIETDILKGIITEKLI